MAGVPIALMVPLIASLSLDTFAVSTAVGIAPLPSGLRLRFAAACALSEAAMPLLGFAAGGLAGRIGSVADWLAVAVLLGAGLWTLREAREDDDEVGEALAAVRMGGVAMIAAALSVGLDELAVGVALLGDRAGKRAALLAGLALCGAALWLAALHLAGGG